LRIYYGKDALADLRRLHEFLQPKSPRTADRAVRAIRSAIAGLEHFPHAGRVHPDGLPSHREVLVPF